MSDEENRREQRLAAAGAPPSLRRLVELSRLAGALSATADAARGHFRDVAADSLLGRMSVRALLVFQRGFGADLEVDRWRDGVVVRHRARIEDVDRIVPGRGETFTVSFDPSLRHLEPGSRRSVRAARVAHFFPFADDALCSCSHLKSRHTGPRLLEAPGPECGDCSCVRFDRPWDDWPRQTGRSTAAVRRALAEARTPGGPVFFFAPTVSLYSQLRRWARGLDPDAPALIRFTSTPEDLRGCAHPRVFLDHTWEESATAALRGRLAVAVLSTRAVTF